MFDRTVFIAPERRRTEYVTREVNVHEHRAPTDESIKLVRQYEERARESIVDQIVVSDNSVNFKAVVYYMADKMAYEVRFSGMINGRSVKGSAVFRGKPSLDETFRTVCKSMAEAIVDEMMGTLAPQIISIQGS